MPASTPLSPRQRALFNQILGSFLAEGFAHFTIDQATKDYHCSKSTLYGIGATKEEIIERLLVSFFKEVSRRTELACQGSRPAKEKLAAYFEAITLALEPASHAFMNDLIQTSIGRKVYSTNTIAATKAIHRLIEEGIQEGSFRASNAQLIASFTGHLMEHIQQGDYRELASIHESYAALGELVVRGLEHAELQE